MKKTVLSFGAIVVLAATTLTSCGKADINDNILTVGASPTPHALILEAARPLIEEKGYQLEIKEFDDYVLPNDALKNGELDANYFQHEPYLLDYCEKNKADLVSAGVIHFEPLGLYSEKKNDVSLFTSGDEILVPSDASNYARALLLLADNDVISLKTTENGFSTTEKDIESTNGIKITRMEAQAIPAALKDAAGGVVNGNYALNAKITDKLVVRENDNSIAGQTRGNIIAVRKGTENSEAIKVLMECLKSETVKNYINTTFPGYVIPLF